MDFTRPFLEGKHWAIQILFILFFVIAGVILFSALGLLVAYLVFHTTDPYAASDPAAHLRISQTFSSIGIFLVPSLLFAYGQDKHCFSYNDANRKPYYLLTNVTLLLSIVLLPLVAILAEWNQSLTLPESMAGLEETMKQMEDKTADLMKLLTFNHTYPTLILNIIVLGLVPAVCEEFFFQGTVQAFMTKTTRKPHLSIWITALIFSVMHFQFYGFLPRFLLGAYLGYLFYWSRSLWLPILAHFLHNALSIIVDFTMASRGILTDEIQFSQVRGGILMVVACTLVTVVSLTFMWRVQKDMKK